jgi:hypothetical protein
MERIHFYSKPGVGGMAVVRCGRKVRLGIASKVADNVTCVGCRFQLDKAFARVRAERGCEKPDI